MIKKKTVTIGIPAHNESSTILRLLGQLMLQDNEKHILEKIIVCCDGCTDNTAEMVEDYSKTYPIVKVVNDGMRKGKSGRLADFYKNNASDVFISLDADIHLGKRNLVDSLVECFDSSDVGLVGGMDIPCKACTFTGKVISAGINTWFYIREGINGGDSVHNNHGCVCALSYSFCQAVDFDSTVVSDDEYLYLRAKELGYGFKFCKDAVVYYSAPNNLSDYFIQSARFMGFKNSLEEKMGKWINSYYFVPNSNKFLGILKSVISDPIHVPFAIFLQLYIHIVYEKYLEKNIDGGSWTSIASTKR